MTANRSVLQAAIQATTGTVAGFAKLIGSDRRTVTRWLAGDRPMPGPAIRLCELLAARPRLARGLTPWLAP